MPLVLGIISIISKLLMLYLYSLGKNFETNRANKGRLRDCTHTLPGPSTSITNPSPPNKKLFHPPNFLTLQSTVSSKRVIQRSLLEKRLEPLFLREKCILLVWTESVFKEKFLLAFKDYDLPLNYIVYIPINLESPFINREPSYSEVEIQKK